MKKIIPLVLCVFLVGCTSMEPKLGYVCEMSDNSETYAQNIDFDYSASNEVTTILFQTVLPASNISEKKLKEAQKEADKKYDKIKGAKATVHYDDSEKLVMLETKIDLTKYNIEEDTMHLFTKELRENGSILQSAFVKYLETDDVFSCTNK